MRAAGQPGRLPARGRQAQPVWVFDLDNTLHDASPHIFPRMNQAMSDYLVTHVGVAPEEAHALRQRYWTRYGATLLGLMRHHGTNPQHFLTETHRFPDLARIVFREPGLRHALRRLRGRRVVFSNSPASYAAAVLALLRIGDLFDGVFSIESTRYRPKPDPEGFRRLFRSHDIDPARAIMVEDSPVNLRAAKRLGMRTVWVTGEGRRPPYVDHLVRTVVDLPRIPCHP